jgi:TPR repeat protein
MITQQVNQWMDFTMDGTLTHGVYRCVFKQLRIGSKEYPVLDLPLAQERANHFLSLAIQRMNHGNLSIDDHLQINEYLLAACDFGSKDAPFLLAARALHPDARLAYPAEEAIVFLKLAAEREHAEAAYQLACCHAGMGRFVSTESGCQRYFTEMGLQEKVRLAEYYFSLAIDHGHQDAIEDLIIAYAYGRGHIAKNVNKFIELCEKFVAKNHQAVTLGYGAWLMGMTVEGDEALSDAVKLSPNPMKALNYLLQASRGDSFELSQHALHLIFLGFSRGVFEGVSYDKLMKQFSQAIAQGNQLLALYFAWYSLPEENPIVPPPMWFKAYPLEALQDFCRPDESKAMAFLDAAFFGENRMISQLAKEILQETFGRYFLDEDLELMDALV